MSRIAAIGLLVWAGCFYLDPINQRPSIQIVPESSATVHRGDTIVLDAMADDPDGQFVAFTWHAQACMDATDVATCAPVFFNTLGPKAMIVIPAFLDDTQADPVPTASVRVVLEGIDAGGAAAKPAQTLVIPVENRLPDVTLRVGSRRTVNYPVELYASVADVDDGPSNVTLEWTVVGPPGAMDPALTEIVDVPQQDAQHLVTGKLFVPDQIGEWTLSVTARDQMDKTAPATTEMTTFTVVPDHAPCLGLVTPTVPPPGQPLPIYDPTLFQVLVVGDDLDPYPGTTTFHWSQKVGAGAREPIGATNSTAFDPAAFTPGTIVELRVEIEDRNHTPVNCPDTDPTCSVISDDACLQRQTWRVEVQ